MSCEVLPFGKRENMGWTEEKNEPEREKRRRTKRNGKAIFRRKKNALLLFKSKIV